MRDRRRRMREQSEEEERRVRGKGCLEIINTEILARRKLHHTINSKFHEILKNSRAQGLLALARQIPRFIPRSSFADVVVDIR